MIVAGPHISRAITGRIKVYPRGQLTPTRLVGGEPTITGGMNSEISLMSRKKTIGLNTINFIIIFPRNISTQNYEGREGLRLNYCVRIRLSWSFVSSQCCVLSRVTKILMHAILNVQSGRIWPAGYRSPTPGLHQQKILPGAALKWR